MANTVGAGFSQFAAPSHRPRKRAFSRSVAVNGFARVGTSTISADAQGRRTGKGADQGPRTQTGGATPPVPAGLSMALGSAYFRNQNIELAEKEYLEAIRVEPGFGEAHNNLAVIYLITGRLDLADTEVAQAEKAGFNVNPKLKEDLKNRRK